MGIEQPPSPEIPSEQFGELLLSGEIAGEGGRAVIIKITEGLVSSELYPAFASLDTNKDGKEHKAIKLFKLYLPNKGRNEYEIHERVQALIEDIPEVEKNNYARVPELSTSRDVSFGPEMRHKLEERFSLAALGEKSILIGMEYIEGEDLATIFYKWILERDEPALSQKGLSPNTTDKMSFGELYLELAKKLDLEGLATGELDAPQDVIEQADWKASQRNTNKIYTYLRKNNFPMPTHIIAQFENTLKLMHRGHMTHGDAFERNLMVTGGTKALREKGTLENENGVLIDFGESRDHFVEQVDDFNVVRRLKTLSISREEELKLAKDAELQRINDKADLVRGNKKWQFIFNTARKGLELDTSDKNKVLETAWNSTVLFKEDGIEDFFVIVKDGIQEGLLDKGFLETFLQSKSKEPMSPYKKNLLVKCIEWLNIQ